MLYSKSLAGILSVSQLLIICLLVISCEPGDYLFDKSNGLSAWSKSSEQSKQFNVFIRKIKCTPGDIKLGDSVDIKIKECFMEYRWFCGPYCKSVSGIANDSLNAQIVLICSAKSKENGLNSYWIISANDLNASFSGNVSAGYRATHINPKVKFPLVYHISKGSVFQSKNRIILQDVFFE